MKPHCDFVLEIIRMHERPIKTLSLLSLKEAAVFPKASVKLKQEVCKEVYQLPKQDWGYTRKGLSLTTTNTSHHADPSAHILRTRFITFPFYCTGSWKMTLKWENSDVILRQLGFSLC